MAISYKDAGVDKNEGYKEVKLIKEHIKRTLRPEVMADIGGFSGLFKLKDYKKPVLVSGTDGVGTKLKFAFMTGIHNTVGIDAVAMCVNDILCQGAEPLFFLDYIATGKLIAEKMADIVEGVAEGCVQSGCALIGGETAEMPGFYSEDEYDIAGFAVGCVEEDEIIDYEKSVKVGDVLVGLPSSGVHSNGFSLVRKILETKNIELKKIYDGFDKPLDEVLLTPTRIYKKAVFEALKTNAVHGMCHITGGGFYENIPRMMPEGMAAKVTIKDIKTPHIFDLIQDWGGVETKEMYGTFNMGIGFVFAIEKNAKDEFIKTLEGIGEKPVVIGEVVNQEGDKCVIEEL